MTTDTTMTTVEVLKAAREKISDPNHWCQGNSAVTREGEPITPTDADAAQWCAAGAIELVMGEHRNATAWDVAISCLRHAAATLFSTSLVGSEVNDEMGHKAVMQMYDYAIKQLDGDESVAGGFVE